VPDLQTERLSISFRDTGPRDGKTALLLHGWPDDCSTWDAVAEKLNWGGIRTIMPNLRGFGDTRFLSDEAERTANSGVLAMDAIALMDGLGIEEFAVAGHDWGSSVAEALAVGWPDRIPAIAMLSVSPQSGSAPAPAGRQAQPEWWSRWFHAKGQGAGRVHKDRKSFALAMWKNWSPPGWFDEETFEQVARSFENPDWLDVTLHAYRNRWGEAPPDTHSIWLEERVRETRTLSLPALIFHGARDGVVHPEATYRIAEKFDGPFEYVLLPEVGHFPTREAPDMVGDLLTEHFGGC